MNIKILIIPALLISQFAGAQNGAGTYTISEASVTNTATTGSATAGTTTSTDATAAGEGQVSYLDYKSVYEAATIEEEVKMATERFTLTPAQQEVWLKAATDRRAVELMA